MKKRILCILISLLMVLSVIPAGALAQEDETPVSYDNCAAGEAIVCMEKASPFSRSAVPDLLSNAEVLMDLSEQPAAMARSASSESSSQVLALVRDDSRSTESLIEELNTYPQVVFAEPNYNIFPITDENTVTDDPALEDAPAEEAQTDGAAKMDNAPAATPAANEAAVETPAAEAPQENAAVTVPSSTKIPDMTDYQWAYQNTSKHFSSLEGFDMNYDGWNKGSSSDNDDVVIAVLDTGVDHNNPDLKDKMWNRGSLPLDGGDHGISFAGDDRGDTMDPPDGGGHGTHCAGIVGAAWNGEGVSGTSKDAKIMAIRYGGGISSVLSCYAYMAKAIELGVNLKAVNCSFTTSSSPKSLDLAVKDLGEMGMISVYGSANSATDNDRTGILSSTFIDNPYAIVADASNAYGLLAAYSCFGERTTDVVAPGSRILSTWLNPEDKRFYYPEFSNNNLFYEGFEDANSLKFYANPECTGDPSGEIAKEKVYNGTSSLKLQGTAAGNVVYSKPVDLKSAAGFDASKAYRFSLNVAGKGGHGAAQAEVKVKLTDGSFASLGDGEAENASLVRGRDGGFNGFNTGIAQILPANTDYEHFQLCLTLKGVEMIFPNGHGQYEYKNGAVYIDNIGVGDETLPYNYSDGTSMATPMVTGAVAVLAERYPADSAAMRAARVIGSVRKYDEFKDKCVSDGMIDLSEDATDHPYPVVNAADITSDTVTIDGYFFGKNPAVTIGGKTADIQSTENAEDGGQRLVVTRPADVSGMARVSVTSSERGEGHQSYDFGAIKDVDYFENTLPLPELPEHSSFYDVDAYQMVGYGDYLYCIPHYYTFGENVSSLWRFNVNTKAWDQLALPENVQLFTASGVVWQDKLLIYNSEAEAFMSYDGNTWNAEANFAGKNFPYSTTLVNNNGQLLAIGGYDIANGFAPTNKIYSVDLENTSITPMGNTLRSANGPLVSAGHGQLIVTGGLETGNQNGTLPGVERLTLENDVFVPANLDMAGIKTGNLSGFASAAVKDGFMLVGPETTDGATDTYTLGTAGNLTPYSKRVDNASLANPSAAAYKGQFYVLARTYTTDSNFIFKSTAVQTDNPVNPDKPADKADNANTGLSGALPMAGVAALLLICAAGFMVWMVKRRSVR